MPIFKPGQRFRNHNLLKRKSNKRSVMAVLSLTAMVDMFTVLAIFLLQNYNATGEVIHIPKEVLLPQANQVIELKPSVVLTITKNYVMIDDDVVANLSDLKNSSEWVLPAIKDRTKRLIDKARQEQEAKLQNRLAKVVRPNSSAEDEDVNAWKKVTIQADKTVDYLTIKKIMYTVYEAGGGPINFAVAKISEGKNDTESNENQ